MTKSKNEPHKIYACLGAPRDWICPLDCPNYDRCRIDGTIFIPELSGSMSMDPEAYWYSGGVET